MKKLNNKNLDVYIYIKEFVKKNKMPPTYREILDNCNYNSVAGVKSAVDKLQIMRNADEIVNYKKEIKIMNKELKNDRRY